jgi:transcriptional regulator with XRE-family HTH domain
MLMCMAIEKVAYSPEKLKELREKKGLKPQDLARLTGMTRQAITKYENNEVVPTEKALVLIGKALHVLFYADWENERKFPKSKKDSI